MNKLHIVFLAFFLVGCSGLRHYKKVSTDTNVTPEKKAVIAPWVSAHFPTETKYIKGEETVVIDSIYNKKVFDSLSALLQGLDKVPPEKLNIDSIRNALIKICTPTVIRETVYRVDTIVKKDEAAFFTLKKDYDVAVSDNILKQERIKDLEKKLANCAKSKKNLNLLLILAGIAITGLLYLIFKPK